jgi:hypothetical protein
MTKANGAVLGVALVLYGSCLIPHSETGQQYSIFTSLLVWRLIFFVVFLLSRLHFPTQLLLSPFL